MGILGMSKEEIKNAVREGKVTIAIFGLGYVGLPLAVVFAISGARVIGVDVDEEKIRKVNRGENYIHEEKQLAELLKQAVREGRLIATTDPEQAARSSDVMIVCVRVSSNENGYIDLTPLLDVISKIGRGLKKGDVVVVETTVPPGTTESLIPILEKESGLRLGEFGVAYSPERIRTGTAIEDIVEKYPKIVGASDRNTLEAVSGLFEVICKKGVILASSIRVAEAAKIFDGIYLDVNIALANELAMWAEEHGIDVMEAIELANTHPERHIRKPGAGVGGHCIPVYPWFLINTSKRHNLELTRLARRINMEMPHHIVYLVIRGLNKIGKPVRGSNILVLGLAFRGGIGIISNSPALAIIRELKELGANVYVHDPYVDKEQAVKLGVTWKEDFTGIDAVVITTDHEEYKSLDPAKLEKEMRNKVVIDGRNILDYRRFIAKGFVYLGPGRTFDLQAHEIPAKSLDTYSTSNRDDKWVQNM